MKTERAVSSRPPAPVELRVDVGAAVRNLLVFCVGLQILFFTLDFHLNYANGARSSAVRVLFNTASEDSLASWFSIMQTAAVALTVWAIYAIVRGGGTRLRRIGWLTLAGFFSYLAFDDGARIHERLGTAYHDYFSGSGVAGTLGAWTLDMFPSYRWQIVFMPVFAAIGLFMFAFLLRELRSRSAKVVVFVALGLLAAAVGLDFFEGLDPEHPWNPYTAIAGTWHLDYWTARTFEETPYDTLVHFSKSIEECTEMFAMTLLWCVFLGHLGFAARDLRIRAAGLPGADDEPVAAEPRTELRRAA